MDSIKEQIEKTLKIDPLQKAEELTGKSYKTGDNETLALGILENMMKAKKMENLMLITDDVSRRDSASEYARKMIEFGFKPLVREQYIASAEADRKEFLFIMFHYEYSILSVWTTYCGQVNGGKIYYNWVPNEYHNFKGVQSGRVCHNGDPSRSRTYISLFNQDLTPHILPEELRSIEPHWGDLSWDEYREKENEWEFKVDKYIKENDLINVWSGDHHASEAVKFHVRQLLENGKFVQNWVNQPFLWLLTDEDTKDKNYDYKAINERRIALLPEDVQQRIKGILK